MTSCLKSMLRIAVLSLCAMSALAAFNWDRCDKVNGPEQWAGLCGDKEQSPIDVCGATDNTNVQIAALQFAAGYATDKVYKFRSDGQAYIDASTLGLSMTAGQLAQTVGRSTNSANDTWNLAQAHFHWGRDKTDGSEHYIEGEQYTLELHFVHVNSKYMKEDKPDIGGALASGNADALLVVGQMFEVGDTESAAMTAMIAQMGKGGETGADTTMKASELIDASAGFYSYAGSLTTPTCNAVVTWVVLVSVKTIKGVLLHAMRLRLVCMCLQERVMSLWWVVQRLDLRFTTNQIPSHHLVHVHGNRGHRHGVQERQLSPPSGQHESLYIQN